MLLRTLKRLNPRVLLTTALILCDVVGVNAGFVGSYVLLYDREIAGIYRAPEWRTVAQFLVLLNLSCAMIFMAYRLYIFKRAGSRVDEAYKVFIASTIATLGASVIATIVGLRFTTWNLVGALCLTVFVVVILRNILRSLIYHARASG